MGFMERTKAALNDLVSHSVVGRYFHLEGSGHPKAIAGARFTTEIRAGLTTFFTMAYIIAVNVCLPAPQLHVTITNQQPTVRHLD